MISGFLKGGKKSLYNSVVNLILLLGVAGFTALISLRWFISPANLYKLLNYFAPRISDEVAVLIANNQSLIEEPETYHLLMGLLDLPFKLICFYLIFPFFRLLIKNIAGTIIWRKVFLKKILQKQNALEEKSNENKLPLDDQAASAKSEPLSKNELHRQQLKKQKIKKSVGSRFLGLLYGGITGLITALICLVPILFTSSLVKDTNLENLHSETPIIEGVVLDPQIISVIELLNLSSKGRADDLLFNLDDELFDFLFGGSINASHDKLKIASDLQNLVDSLNIALDNKLVDYQNISFEDAKSIETIINNLSDLSVLKVVNIASLLLANNQNARELFNQVVLQNALSWEVLEDPLFIQYLILLAEINIGHDLSTLGQIAITLLNYGSVGQLIDLLNFDFASLSGLDFEQIEQILIDLKINQLSPLLLESLYTLGRVDLLNLWGLGIFLLPNYIDLAPIFAFVDDPQTYYYQRFNFILSNSSYFTDEHFSQLVDIIAPLLQSDQLSSLLNNILGANYYDLINPNYNSLFGEVFDSLGNSDLLINILPVAFDYYFSTFELSPADYQSINDSLNEVEFNWELDNLGLIYADLSQISLNFMKNKQYLEFIDYLFEYHSATINTVVRRLFEDSVLMSNFLFDIAPLTLAKSLDPDIQELIFNILHDNPDLKNSFGGDIVRLVDALTIFASQYDFVNYSKEDNYYYLIQAIQLLSNEDMASIASKISSMSLVSSLSYLLDYLYNRYSLINYVDYPQFINYPDLIYKSISLVKPIIDEISLPTESVNNEQLINDLKTNINLLSFLKNHEITKYLVGEQRIEIINQLVASLILRNYQSGYQLDQYLKIPEDLQYGVYYGLEWDQELNNLLSGIFGVVEDIDINYIMLNIDSFANLQGLIEDLDLYCLENLRSSTSLDTLFNSRILLNTLDHYYSTVSEQLLGTNIAIPDEIRDSSGILIGSYFSSLIRDSLNFVYQLYPSSIKIAQLIAIKDDYDLFLVPFNDLSIAEVSMFASNPLLNIILKDFLNNSQIHQKLLEATQNLKQGILSDEIFDVEVNTNLEFYHLLRTLRMIGLTSQEINNFSTQIFQILPKITSTVVEELLASQGVYQILNNIVQDHVLNFYLRQQISSLLYNLITEDFDFDYQQLIDNILDFPLNEGNLRSDFVVDAFALVNAFTLANREEFNLLTSGNWPFIRAKIVNTPLAIDLGNNDISNFLFSYLFGQEQVADLLGNIFQKKLIKNEEVFSSGFLNFKDQKYNLFDLASERLYPLEITKLIYGLLEVDINFFLKEINIKNLVNFAKQLQEASYFQLGISHIEGFSSSNIIISLFDMFLNPHNLNDTQVVVSIFNNLLPNNLNLSPNFLNIHPLAFNDLDVLKANEINSLVKMLSRLNGEASDYYQLLYSLKDDDNPQDDGLKYYFESYVLKSLTTNFLNDSGYKNFICDYLTIISPSPTIFDLHPLMLDVDGLLFEIELRNLLTSLEIIDLASNFEAKLDIDLILKHFNNNYDPLTNEDDLDRIFRANYLYLFVARILDEPYLYEKVQDIFGSMLPLNSSLEVIPLDARGLSGIEENLVTRIELRKVVQSLWDLDVRSISELENKNILDIVHLMGLHNRLLTPSDDFDMFIDSIIIWNILSLFINNEMIIHNLAAGNFDGDDFVLPSKMFDENIVGIDNRILKIEIRRFFISLTLIDLSATGSVNFSLNNISNFNTSSREVFFESIYLLGVFDNILRKNDRIVVPWDSVIHDPNDREYGLIAYGEILNILDAFNIIGSVENFNPAIFSVDILHQLVNLNNYGSDGSPIFDTFLTANLLDIIASVPTGARYYYDPQDVSIFRVLHHELLAILDAFMVLDEDLIIDDIANALANLSYQNFNLIVNQADVNNGGSYLILRLLSDSLSLTTILANNNFAYVSNAFSSYGYDELYLHNLDPRYGADLWYSELLGVGEFLLNNSLDLGALASFLNNLDPISAQATLVSVLSTRGQSIIATAIALNLVNSGVSLFMSLDFEVNVVNQLRIILGLSILDSSNDDYAYYSDNNLGELIFL
jgi:hypothetical protein